MDKTPQQEELWRRIKDSSILALPQSAAMVLQLSKDENNGPPEYAVPISADPGLTAQILKFANSSFFGFRYKITTIQMALSLICVRTVKNFVLWNALFALMPNPKVGLFQLKRFFQDALRRGIFCKLYAAQFEQLDPEELFVAGLFQDIAVPVLVQNWSKEYDRLLRETNDNGARLSDLEQECFGWTHADAGAMLVTEWGLGDSYARFARNHLTCDFDAVDTPDRLADAIVYLSSMLPSSGDEQWSDADSFFAHLHKINRTLLKPGAAMEPGELFAAVDEQYGDMLKITQTPPPTRTLVDFQKLYFQTFE